MSITQTVEIPASHRLTIDVPPEIPPGPTVIVFRPAAELPCSMTTQEAIEAIKQCDGLFKRLDINLSSDEFLEMRRRDRELEDRLDR
jgi:hypothetical protein